MPVPPASPSVEQGKLELKGWKQKKQGYKLTEGLSWHLFFADLQM